MTGRKRCTNKKEITLQLQGNKSSGEKSEYAISAGDDLYVVIILIKLCWDISILDGGEVLGEERRKSRPGNIKVYR